MTHHSQVIARILADRPLEPRLGAEIGVQSGNTSEALLRAFPRLTLYMIDPWAVPQPDSSFALSGDPTAREPAERWGEAYRRATSRVAFAGPRAVILRHTSVEAAGRIDPASLDFVFVDGDHSSEGVLRDAQTWWPKVRPGGLLFFHDYGNTADWTRGVKPAVDEFATSVQRTVVVEQRYVAWIYR